MKIIKFEFEKVLKNKIVIGSLVISFIVLLGIFFVGYNYSQFKMSERNNVNKGFPKNIDTIISQKYAGDFTDKKVQMILSDSMNQFQENEEKGVTDKPFYLFYWQMGDNFFDDDSENIYTEMIQKVKSGERLLLDDVSVHSIRDLGFTEFEKPLQIGNYVPWTDFFSVIGNINLLICVLTILICSTIFSNDTCLTKKVIKRAAMKYNRDISRRLKHEVPFSEISDLELNKAGVYDKYSSDYTAFNVLGMEVQVSDDQLSKALKCLPERKRNIILLSYFMDMSDAEIGELMNVVRTTVYRHRTSTLEDLRKMMEEE